MNGNPNLQQVPRRSAILTNIKPFDPEYYDQYGIRERYIQNARPFDYEYRSKYDTTQSDVAWFFSVLYGRDTINDKRDLDKFLHGTKSAFSHTLELLVQAKGLMEEHLAEVENPELDAQVVALQKKIDQWKSSGTIN